jgi:thiol-disulfide isomerase/thioredoxin
MPMNKDQFKQIIESKSQSVVFKLGATWCAPCIRAAPTIESEVAKLSDKIKYYELDVDTSLDVYGMLKSKKMVSGIPSLLCYYEDNTSIWPDEAISTSKEEDICAFFKLISQNV